MPVVVWVIQKVCENTKGHHQRHFKLQKEALTPWHLEIFFNWLPSRLGALLLSKLQLVIILLICSLSVVLSPFLLLITHIFAVSLFFSTTIKKRLSILLVFSKHWILDSLNFSTSYYFLLHQFKSLSLLLFPRFYFYVLFLNS